MLISLDLYCFHYEAVASDEEIEKIIEHIKAKGMKVGLAIKPKTPSSVLYPFIDKLDMALVMVPISYLSKQPALCPSPWTICDVVDCGTRFRRPEGNYLLLLQSPRPSPPVPQLGH